MLEMSVTGLCRESARLFSVLLSLSRESPSPKELSLFKAPSRSFASSVVVVEILLESGPSLGFASLSSSSLSSSLSQKSGAK